MTTVILAEKPSQGRDIAHVIGANQRRNGALYNKEFIVTWCIGHLLEMANPDAYDASLKRWSLQALPIQPERWKLQVKDSTRQQYEVVRHIIEQAHTVIIATDADREGEVIAREVLEKCHFKGAIQRLWLSALDPKSIRKAFQQLLPDEKTRPLYYAGLARSRADWLVGMNLSRYFTLTSQATAKERNVLSVGRVQTPTLRLVVDRDREIENFKPQPYWDLIIKANTLKGVPYLSKWMPEKSAQKTPLDQQSRCVDEAAIRRISALILNKPGDIQSVKAENKRTAPPLGYDLSTLQTEASSKWGFSADKTLKLAQSLYETHKICSYPRTDCQYLPDSQYDDRHDILDKIGHSLPHFSETLSLVDRDRRSLIWNQKKVDQASHHAIIPTSYKANMSRLNSDERKLYERICRRYLAQFFPDYQFRHTHILTQCEEELFTASGKVILDRGWHRAYQTTGATRKTREAPGSYVNQDLPALKKGESVTVFDTEVAAKKTEPPPRFTEGSLIRAMKSIGRMVNDPALKKVLRETSGIGQEATRANIIKTLIQRTYIKTNKKQLISTSKGRSLIDAVPETAKSPETTAIWEQTLEEIAQNQTSMEQFIAEQQQWIRTLITAHNPATAKPEQPLHSAKGKISATHSQQSIKSNGYRQNAKMAKTAQQNSNHPNCPECGANMVKRQAKSGQRNPFWGCQAFPKCRHTISIRDE